MSCVRVTSPLPRWSKLRKQIPHLLDGVFVCFAASPFPQKVTLAAAVRLQSLSQRLDGAVTFLWNRCPLCQSIFRRNLHIAIYLAPGFLSGKGDFCCFSTISKKMQIRHLAAIEAAKKAIFSLISSVFLKSSGGIQDGGAVLSHISANKIRKNSRFAFWHLNPRYAGRLLAAQQICHIPAQHPHGIQSFRVLLCLLRICSMNHIPVS